MTADENKTTIIFYKYEFVKEHGSKTITSDKTILVCCRCKRWGLSWTCNSIKILNIKILKFYLPEKIEYYWINEKESESPESRDTNGTFKHDIISVHVGVFPNFKYSSGSIEILASPLLQKELFDHYANLISQEQVDKYITHLKEKQHVNRTRHFEGRGTRSCEMTMPMRSIDFSWNNFFKEF